MRQLREHLEGFSQIVASLLEMGAAYRKFEHHTMLSGVIDLRNMKNQEVVFGRKLPEATPVSGIDPKRDAYRPDFEFVPRMKKDLGQPYTPERSSVTRLVNHCNVCSPAAA